MRLIPVASFLLFATLLTSAAFAKTGVRRNSGLSIACGTQANDDPFLRSLEGEGLMNNLMDAVSAGEVEDAHCLSRLPKTTEIKNWFLKNKSDVRALAAELVPAGIEIPESAKSCADSICTIEKIFGDDVGLKLLYLLDRYGVNGSHLALNEFSKARGESVHAAPWSEFELKQILLAFEDLPAPKFDLRPRQPLERLNHGELLPGAAGDFCVRANSSFQFSDCYFRDRAPKRRAIAVHEIAHFYTEQMGYDFMPDSGQLSKKVQEWMALSGWSWNKTSEGWDGRAQNEQCLMAKNARNGPNEDMAEAITTYRYKPAFLKKFCPQKYEFLKRNIFAGREYLRPSQCEKSHNFL